MGLLSRIKTWTSEVLTASDLNAEFDNILNNLTPTYVDDISANAAAMQTTADPYPGSAASLATTLTGEIQRLRYLIAQITGETYWYYDPNFNLSMLEAATAAGTDTYTATLAPAPAAYVTGMIYLITFTNGNTSPTPTLNLNSLGAKTIVKGGAAPLGVGDIPAAHAAVLMYNGTQFVLMNPYGVTVGSDADGDMYYRASNVLARLAKGTANYKMFMNAGATAPEWGLGIKAGTFTRDLSADAGDVAYTSVGFKPSHVIFLAGGSNGVTVGIDNGTVHYYVLSAGAVDATDATKSIWCGGVTPGSNFQTAIIKTLDTDGFTLTWAKSGSPAVTATIFYIAFR
jgi:hypothetical protein